MENSIRLETTTTNKGYVMKNLKLRITEEKFNELYEKWNHELYGHNERIGFVIENVIQLYLGLEPSKPNLYVDDRGNVRHLGDGGIDLELYGLTFDVKGKMVKERYTSYTTYWNIHNRNYQIDMSRHNFILAYYVPEQHYINVLAIVPHDIAIENSHSYAKGEKIPEYQYIISDTDTTITSNVMLFRYRCTTKANDYMDMFYNKMIEVNYNCD